MNQIVRAGVVALVVWSGISIFRSIVRVVEEEELARLGAGESDYQKHHPCKQ